MARLLSLIVCAVAAVASWNAGRAFFSVLPSLFRKKRTEALSDKARGGAYIHTVVLPEAFPDEATNTDVHPATPAGRKIAQTVNDLVAAAEEVSVTTHGAAKVSTSKKASPFTKKASTGGRLSAVGIFSPLVEAAKSVLGEEELANFRGEAIKAHTAVITAFTASLSPQADTGYGTPNGYAYFGEATIRSMFKLADADGSGSVDVEELRKVVKTLGFKWLEDDAKISKIMEKMDKNGNEMIDLEEFMATAPVVLRQNLVKLAKKNGNELGFLV